MHNAPSSMLKLSLLIDRHMEHLKCSSAPSHLAYRLALFSLDILESIDHADITMLRKYQEHILLIPSIAAFGGGTREASFALLFLPVCTCWSFSSVQDTAVCHNCDEMIAPEDRVCGECQTARSAKVNGLRTKYGTPSKGREKRVAT